MEPSALRQKVVEQFSPGKPGRQPVAHGASRGSAACALTPVPSPARRERGAEGGVRAIRPRAHALGYSTSPLPRLKETDAPEKTKGKSANFQFPFSSFRFLPFCFLLSAFGFLVSARAADPGNAEALIEAGHWKRARAIVEPRVAANPRDAQAVWLLSRIKLAFGDLDGALSRTAGGGARRRELRLPLPTGGSVWRDGGESQHVCCGRSCPQIQG